MSIKCGRVYRLMYKDDGVGSETALIPTLCKSWSCPTCRLKKAMEVRSFIRNNFASKKVWMITITFSHQGTPLGAWKSIGKNLNRMLCYARKYTGRFNYIRVVEPHKDGSWPHIHMLVDQNICSPAFVSLVTSWGFGWNFHCTVMDGVKASNYMSKYLTKPWPQGDGDLLRQMAKTRIVSASRALGPIFYIKPSWKIVEMSNPFRQIPFLETAVVQDLHEQGATMILVTPIADGFFIKADAVLSPNFIKSIKDPFLWDSCDALHQARLYGH